jgi:hypothetical protein
VDLGEIIGEFPSNLQTKDEQEVTTTIKQMEEYLSRIWEIEKVMTSGNLGMFLHESIYNEEQLPGRGNLTRNKSLVNIELILMTVPELPFTSKHSLPLGYKEKAIFDILMDPLRLSDNDLYHKYSFLPYEQKRKLVNENLKRIECMKPPKDVPFQATYKGYVIQTNAILHHQDIKIAFLIHLEAEANSWRYHFLLNVHRMDDVINTITIKRFEDLVDRYIVEKHFALSLASDMKVCFLEKIKDHVKGVWEYQEAPKSLFDPIKRCVLADLQSDPFERFSDSPAGYNVISNHWKDRSVIIRHPKEVILEKIVKCKNVPKEKREDIASKLASDRLTLDAYFKPELFNGLSNINISIELYDVSRLFSFKKESHIGVYYGPLLLNFTNELLCIPEVGENPIVDSDDLMYSIPIEKEGDLNTANTIVSKVLCEWNSSYDDPLRVSDFDFVHELLVKLGLREQNEETITVKKKNVY